MLKTARDKVEKDSLTPGTILHNLKQRHTIESPAEDCIQCSEVRGREVEKSKQFSATFASVR